MSDLRLRRFIAPVSMRYWTEGPGAQQNPDEPIRRREREAGSSEEQLDAWIAAQLRTGIDGARAVVSRLTSAADPDSPVMAPQAQLRSAMRRFQTQRSASYGDDLNNAILQLRELPGRHRTWHITLDHPGTINLSPSARDLRQFTPDSAPWITATPMWDNPNDFNPSMYTNEDLDFPLGPEIRIPSFVPWTGILPFDLAVWEYYMLRLLLVADDVADSLEDDLGAMENPRGEAEERRRVRVARLGGLEDRDRALAEAYRRGGPKAQAALWAELVRGMPDGTERDLEAVRLGEFLQAHLVEPIVKESVIKTAVPVALKGKRRMRRTGVFGLDNRYGPPAVHVATQTSGPHYSRDPRHFEEVFPQLKNFARWVATSEDFAIPGTLIWHRNLGPVVTRWFTDAVLALPPSDLSRLFLADLYIHGFAAFQDDMASLMQEDAIADRREQTSIVDAVHSRASRLIQTDLDPLLARQAGRARHMPTRAPFPSSSFSVYDDGRGRFHLNIPTALQQHIPAVRRIVEEEAVRRGWRFRPTQDVVGGSNYVLEGSFVDAP